MKRKLLYIIIFVGFIISACTPSDSTPKSISDLENKINNRLAELEGDFAIAFESLEDSAASIHINTNERFHAASTMKTPVLIEIYKQAEEGNFSVQDSITIHNQFSSIVDGSPYSMQISEDSEQNLYNRVGEKATIYELAYQMMTQSSNLATNILIDYIGAEKVNNSMHELGADSIEVLRGVEDLKAYEAGLSNTTTANDLLVIFRSIASYDLLSEKSHNEIITILKDQAHNDMFPAKLPDSAEVAHKTGWITGVHHDSGIIYGPNGEAFVLVFLSKNAPDREAVQNAAADIAKWCYDFITEN